MVNSLKNQPTLFQHRGVKTMNFEEDIDDEADLSDQSLLRRFQIGDQDAATAIYLRYAKKLQNLTQSQTDVRISLQVDPEGIVQSVFRTFFRRASKGQYNVLDGDELWKLFLVIALNKIRNVSKFHRAAKRDASVTKTLEAVNEIMIKNRLDSDSALQILKLTVDELLANYPIVQQRIISLRIEGCTISEIAEKTGRAKRSIERTLQQFREHLQTQMDI